MKRHAILLATVVTLASLALAPLAPVEAAEGGLRVATLEVQGMTCGGCAVSVKAVVKRIDGVKEAEVSWKEGRAVVTYDASKVEPESIARTIEEKLTYKARVLEDRLEDER